MIGLKLQGVIAVEHVGIAQMRRRPLQLQLRLVAGKTEETMTRRERRYRYRRGRIGRDGVS